MVAKIDRTGETFVTNEGCKAIIVNYVNAREVYIKFEESEELVKNMYSKVKTKSIKNPYLPSLYDKGYFGQGEYSGRDSYGSKSKCYNTWRGILERSYSKELKDKHNTYLTVECCEEWHNYQNFAKWYEDNYYEVEGQRMDLDKDILYKGNKIYSPETCIFVPQRINKLFTKSNKTRGDLPIGVYFHKREQKYVAQCRVLERDQQKFLGYFNTPEEAFNAYKEFKEQYIKQVAEEYKDKIPNKLYEAMLKWEINIED